MKKLLVLSLVLAFATPAMAGFTAASAGPHYSDGPLEAPTVPPLYNGYFQYTYAGPDFDIGDIIFNGTLAETGNGSYESEARINITDPAGVTAGFQPGTQSTGWVSETFVDMAITGAGAFWSGTAGVWTISFSESYDDGGPGDVDAIWTDFSLEFTDGVPPPTLADASLGTLNRGDCQAGDTTGSSDDFQWTPAGDNVWSLNHPGGDLVLDLMFDDVAIDLDLWLFDSAETELDSSMGYTDEHIEGVYPAGTYYALIDGYYGGDEGAYDLCYTPEPATLALLAFGAIGLIRRRR